MSSQINYVICLADAINKTNIIHWSSIKYKRVTRNIFATELYKIAHKFSIKIVIKAMLEKILGLTVLLILCTDLKFLYDYVVIFGNI